MPSLTPTPRTKYPRPRCPRPTRRLGVALATLLCAASTLGNTAGSGCDPTGLPSQQLQPEHTEFRGTFTNAFGSPLPAAFLDETYGLMHGVITLTESRELSAAEAAWGQSMGVEMCAVSGQFGFAQVGAVPGKGLDWTEKANPDKEAPLSVIYGCEAQHQPAVGHPFAHRWPIYAIVSDRSYTESEVGSDYVGHCGGVWPELSDAAKLDRARADGVPAPFHAMPTQFCRHPAAGGHAGGAPTPPNFLLGVLTAFRDDSGDGYVDRIETADGVLAMHRIYGWNELELAVSVVRNLDISDLRPSIGDPIWGPLTDSDGDGVVNGSDRCISVADPDNADADGDFRGDVCDVCPAVFDPAQVDADGDGYGEACDADDLSAEVF